MVRASIIAVLIAVASVFLACVIVGSREASREVSHEASLSPEPQAAAGQPCTPEVRREVVEVPVPPSPKPPLEDGEAFMAVPSLSPRLAPTLEHFLLRLPDSWPITIFVPHIRDRNTTCDIKTHINVSSLDGALDSGRLRCRAIRVPSMGYGMYQKLMTNPFFWRQLFSKEHILMFEEDSRLCASPTYPLEYFLEANKGVIGATWPQEACKMFAPFITKGTCCCNSGLSLWRRSRTIWVMAALGPGTGFVRQSGIVDLRLAAQADLHGLYITDTNVSQYFGVESVYAGGYTPLGVHKPWWRHPDWVARYCPGGQCTSPTDLWAELMDRCPEVTELAGYAERVAADARTNVHGYYRQQAQQFLKVLKGEGKWAFAVEHGAPTMLL